MKAKEIIIKYTDGSSKTVTPKEGFIVTPDKVTPLADWDMNVAYKSMASLMLSTMSAQVDSYGTYRPLFDKLQETTSQIMRQLSPKTWSKEFALKYQQAFLWDEVTHDVAYKDLHEKMLAFTKKAAEKISN